MQNNQQIVVLTGSGISAESGLQTFRGSGGLWEGYEISEVATPQGWKKNPEKVLEFYNKRRKQAWEAQPNIAHLALAELENWYEVKIITQNVDSLHERAGSTQVVHLHGELSKVRSEKNAELIKEIGGDAIQMGDTAEDGAQLRPHVVWFGEAVPMIKKAAEISAQADIFMVVGTSLEVYPAAGLLDYVPEHAESYLIDPSVPDSHLINQRWKLYETPATEGVPKVITKLKKKT